MRSKTVCAGCCKAVGGVFVKCINCNELFHEICSGLESEHVFELVKYNRNIAYICNKCADSSIDLNARVSMLSEEIQELKTLFHAYVKKNNAKENVLLKNDEKTAEINLHEVRSPLRDSCSSNSPNCNTLNFSNEVNAVNKLHHDANLNVVVPAEPVLKSANVRIRRRSLCLIDDDTSHNEVVVTNKVDHDLNSTTARMRKERSFSDNTISNAATAECQAEKDIPVNETDWIHVSKRNRKNDMCGDNNNNELEVIANTKWIHLSSFKPTVTVDKIINYVTKYSNIDKNHLECYKLVKKGANLNELKRISFKLGICPEFYNELCKPSLWPDEVRVRPFKIFQQYRVIK